MLLGLVINYGILAPRLIEQKVIEHPPPQVTADAAPKFPLAVAAGQTLTVELDEAVGRPELPTRDELEADLALFSTMRTRLLVYKWTRPTKYNDVTGLIRDLNAAVLQDGSPNPLHDAIAVGRAKRRKERERLSLKAPPAKYWEATLDSCGPDSYIAISWIQMSG